MAESEHKPLEVLLLDSEQSVADEVAQLGHRVHRGDLGYRSGIPALDVPPHEADVVVIDIRSPALIERAPTRGAQRNVVQFSSAAEADLATGRYRLLLTSELRNARPRPLFGHQQLLEAVRDGGVVVLIFLNKVWLQLMGRDTPSFVGFSCQMAPTVANRVEVVGQLSRVFPELGRDIPFDLPLQYSIESMSRNSDTGTWAAETGVKNSVDKAFGGIYRVGKGNVWAIPACNDKREFMKLFLSRISQVRSVHVLTKEGKTAELLKERYEQSQDSPVAAAAATEPSSPLGTQLINIWPVLRGIITAAYSFNAIKTLAGAAGLPIHHLSHLQQISGSRSSSKGQLMDGIDSLCVKLAQPEQDRFVRNVVQDIWTQREESRAQLSELLERVGWGITDGEPHPLELQVDIEIGVLPDEERKLLSKSLSRFRDGDVDGSVTAICSLVDSITGRIYQEEKLGNHRDDSYQQRVSKAFMIQHSAIVQALTAGGFPAADAERAWHNLHGAVNQAAYVLGAFRREISDVHGTSSAPTAVVQRALDTAVFIVRSFIG